MLSLRRIDAHASSWRAHGSACAALILLVLLLAPSARGATCEDRRLFAVARDHRCRTATEARALRRGETADFSRCDRRFAKIWEKTRGDRSCRTSGEPVARVVADARESLADALRPEPTASAPARSCAARKLREVGRYAHCRLVVHRRAEQRGSVPDFAYCRGKLTRRLADIEAAGGCPTLGDGPALETRAARFTSSVFAVVAAPRPEPPAIARDVALIDDDVRWTRPFVPGHRTTMDGRVAIRVQGAPAGPPWMAENLSFFLFVPERLDDPIMPGASGPEIMAETTRFDALLPVALRPEVRRLGHHAVCDPTEEFAREGERTSPYPCGPDSRHDCYDLTILSSTEEALPGVPVPPFVSPGAQLWGTPARVEVAHPKTVDARIVSVELGTSVEGAYIPLTGEWTEPAITVDGRLLTGRVGTAAREWTNPNTGDTTLGTWDLMYSMLPDDAEPCDVTGWQDFHPISHAPYDPMLIGRYGIAAYPFRDSEGNPIPDGEDVGGTYPWVDREGANLFMAGVQGRLVEQSPDVYPSRCVVPGCEAFTENVDYDRGFMVAGLWTRGKFVHLDGMINNQDWAVGVTPSTHWMVDLYREASGRDVPVRLGSGRFIDEKRYAEGPYPPGYSHNANILDSIQNLPNFRVEAQPVTPRDVVWVMSTGVGTDEIAFDDVLDPEAFILSNMQASITRHALHPSIPHYHNGQVRLPTFLPAVPAALFWRLRPDEAEEIHVQNGATSLTWEVPAYGRVAADTGRIEPTALGGIQGKGFWLRGWNAIAYDVPVQQRDVRSVDWTVSLFVDARELRPELARKERALLHFPDGSAVHLGASVLSYRAAESVVREVPLPRHEGWMHLTWRVRDGGRDITLLVDGFGFDRFTAPTPIFGMSEGPFIVGQVGDTPGFRGWIDELKVLAHDVDPEVACNHARGTLARVVDNAARAEEAAGHPAWAQQWVRQAAGGTAGAAYFCFHDYSRDYAAHLGNLPAGTASAREAITFPEGPVRYGAPRPDSSSNPFCLGCHTTESQAGLSLDALVPKAQWNAEDDPRRQPLQPPRRVFGNVPAGWIAPGPGPGGPDQAMTAPPEGLLIDQWVLPRD